MNPRIETAIRSHLRANDAAQQTIEWAEIVERIENQSPAFVGSGPGRRIGVWIAVAAAVVTIMLIGVVPLLVGGDETPPADTVVPTTLTDASPPTTSVVTEVDGEVVVRTTVGPTQVSGSSIGDIQLTPFDVFPSGITLDSMKSTPLGIVSVGSGGELLISDDGVAWRSVSFEEPRSESASGNQLSLAEWLDGPDYVAIEYGEYKSSAVTPQGSELVYATWAIDWKSVAGLAGGEALQLRLDGDEVLGTNIWDPTTGLVDFTLFKDQTAKDRYSMGDSSVGPESAGVQLRMTISGTTDAWVADLEDAASGTTLGTIKGALPPRGLEDRALWDFTVDDVLDYVATNGRFGSHFLLSGDRLELVDQPP
jgi:hypothetical protein